MATAIPPQAAEVASNRPERQKLRRAGSGRLSSGASSLEGETTSKRNLRSGMDEPYKKNAGKESAEKLIFEKCVYVWEG